MWFVGVGIEGDARVEALGELLDLMGLIGLTPRAR